MLESVIPENQDYVKMWEQDCGFNNGGAQLYAEERAGTLKRELNKTPMSMLISYSLGTANSEV